MDAVTLLGSPFEMSLRILLMLDEIRDAELDEQQICSIFRIQEHLIAA